MTEARSDVWSEASSDAELITAVRAGDTGAFGVLYERHAVAARTVARQYVRSAADADDVVSDAFARTLTVLQGGGGPDVTFRAYLFTVVRRLSYDLVNGARRTQPTDDERTFETAFGPMASTEDPTLEGFERSVVTRAYQTLPERWRAVLWYTEVENLTPAQIAPVLGLTANGVSALAYRAREGLRQAYLQQHLTAAPAKECENVNPLLGSYVRGGLAKRETARVEEHLAGCGDCRALVLELGDVSHGMRAVIAPLVLGVGALGLVGTALPLGGGAAVGAGAAAAIAGAGTGTGAAGTGSGGAGGGSAGAGSAGASSGGAASGGTAASGTAASGTAASGTAATGTAASGTAAAGTAATGSAAAGTVAGGAAATGAATVGAVAGSAGSAAAATGAATGAATTAATVGAVAGGAGTAAAATGAATGIAALIASAPLAAAAVAAGVVAVAGLGVAGALGAFTPKETPTAEPTASTSTPTPGPSDTATGSPSTPTTPSDAPTDPATDPTSPANVPPADTLGGETVAAPATPSDDRATPPPVVDPGVGVNPSTPADPGTPADPAPVDPGGPVDPGPGPGPGPVDPPPVDPPPGPPALDLTLGSVQLTARQPAELAVTASNSGGRAAQQVSVDLVLPPGVQVPSARVVGGSSVAAAVRAETVPCGAAQPQGDGTSVVSCSVGVLAPGESRQLAVTVQADAGGEYTFSGSVRAEGVEPVRRTFTPTPATYFGPEVRVAALDGAGGRVDGLVLPLTNPGAGDVRLEVRNTGDRPAVDPVVSFPLPDGVRLVGGGNGADGWLCQADGAAVSCATDTDLAPQQATAFDLTLLAGAETATGDGRGHPVTISADALDAHDGSTRVVLDVGDWWAGADGLDGIPAPQCTAPDVASVLATYTNGTAYEDLSVRLEAAGSSATVLAGLDEKVTVQVDDGVRFPAGTASVVLSTTVAGEVFEHRLDAGAFGATDCWVQAPWLTAADVAMVAENVGGTVRFTAVPTNGTGMRMDVRLLAPNTGSWTSVADSAAIAPLREGTSGQLVLETGLAETSRANAVLRQYRWHVDADGDGKGYQSLLPLLLEKQTIAPASSAPTVGRCVFDPATDTSSATVTLHYDNRASTLPVPFSVDGRDDLARTVPGGEVLDVEVPAGVGGEPVGFTVRADGMAPASYEIEGVDCFPWNVETSSGAAWTATPEGGSVVLTGTFRNDHAVTAMRVVMDAGAAGESETVEVAPGQESTFAVDTGTRDLPAGDVTFRATRLDGTDASESFDESYDAVRYAPAADAAPTVGECVFDPATDTSSAPVTLHLDNSRSTEPVTFAVAGVGEARVRAGATGTLDATVGTAGARFEVLADGVAVAAHDVAGVDCFRWAVEGSAAVDWAVEGGTGAPVLSGTFHNQHQAAPLRVVMDAGTLGSSDAVEVAPGQTATLTVPLQGRDVKAGEVTLRATRLDGSGAEHTITRPYAAYSYSPQWATDVSVEARWQDGSVKLIATLTNDSPETIDAQVRGSSRGDSPMVRGIAPGQTATLVVDTRATDVAAGRVAILQERTVLGKYYFDLELTAGYGGAKYVPEWAVSAGVSTQCVPGGVALVPSLRNDSGETMHVVARTPYGTHDLGDVAPGASTSVEVATGGMSVKAGQVTFDLTRKVLGRTYTERVTAGYAAVDCTVVDPAASLQLGEPYYDGGQGRSYRAVSVVLDNSGSNVPVSFRVTGAAKGSWDLPAGERRTVELGLVDARGATYVVHAGSWSQQLKVDAFSAAPQCASAWRGWVWYDAGSVVSFEGRNYVANIISLGSRPDGWLVGQHVWADQGRCGEG